MQLNDLELFRCVARLGSMSKAAAESGYVQSNVTSRIQALEQEFGVALLNRSPKGISLRPEGERLLAYAEQIHRLEVGALDAVLVNREPEQSEQLEKMFDVAEPIAWMVGGGGQDYAAANLPLLAARDPKCPYRRQTLEQLKRCDPPRRLIEADTLESLIHIAESGHGLALLPIALCTPSMRFVQLPGFDTEKVQIRCYRKAVPSDSPAYSNSEECKEWERLKALIIR